MTEKCPTCGSDKPEVKGNRYFPAQEAIGAWCPDPWHNTVASPAPTPIIETFDERALRAATILFGADDPGRIGWAAEIINRETHAVSSTLSDVNTLPNLVTFSQLRRDLAALTKKRDELKMVSEERLALEVTAHNLTRAASAEWFNDNTRLVAELIARQKELRTHALQFIEREETISRLTQALLRMLKEFDMGEKCNPDVPCGNCEAIKKARAALQPGSNALKATPNSPGSNAPAPESENP